MVLFKEECGHPMEWNLRVVMNSQKYTYCIGCMVEKLGLDNLETYTNPYIKKLVKPENVVDVTSEPVVESKAKIVKKKKK